MDNLYLAAGVREIDRIAIEEHGIPGIVLMRRAAEACIKALLANWSVPGTVAVFCGSGNNAADGFIIAGLLANRGYQVKVALIGKIPEQASDAGLAYDYSMQSPAERVSVEQAIDAADLLVDALLGTGVSGEVRPLYKSTIEAINDSGKPVLAVDLPSGLCADTGRNLGATVNAEVTVTFIARKLGLMTNDGVQHAGTVVFDDLEVPAEAVDRLPAAAVMLDHLSALQKLPPRHRNAHKMSHGHVLIVGGDLGMPGAVIMTAEAAIQSGAGMVTVATHPENITPLIARRPEVMARGVTSIDALAPLLSRATVVVLGPGLGKSEWSQMLFNAVMGSDMPLLVDADGLNLLAESPIHRDNWVLTPHPGEAGRLLGRKVQDDRHSAVRDLQTRYGGVALLKGAGTLIADGQGIGLCPYGNPGMSVAGMGDVLSGIIGGLMAQGLLPMDAAQLGAVVHALAADNLTGNQGERGLLATELIPEVRRLLNPRRLEHR